MPNSDVLLPLLSLGALALAFFARDGLLGQPGGVKPRLKKSDFGFLIAFIVILGGLFLFNRSSPEYQDGLPATLLGFVGGVFAAAIAYWIGRDPSQAEAGRTVPMALGALCASALAALAPPAPISTLSGTDLAAANAPLAAVFGAALTAWLLGLRDKGMGSSWAVRAAIFLLCVVACNMLGGELAPAVRALGTMFALAAVIAGIVGIGIGQAIGKKDAKLALAGPALTFAFLVLGGYLICKKNGLDGGVSVTFVCSAIFALFVGWVMIEEGALTARVILAAVLWISLAVASFGYTKTLGIAVALSAAAFMSVLVRKERALLALGPLAALVIYRLFRIIQSGGEEAFDIGQYYGLIGFMLGILVPILALEWRKTALSLTTARAWSAGMLWVFLLAAVPVPTAVVLSDKGILGYLVGLGFAPVLEALRGERNAQPLSLSIGLSCAMAFLYGWIAPHLDLERSQKIHALVWILSLMTAAVIGIAALSHVSKTSEAVQS